MLRESLDAARDVRAVVLVVDDDEGLRESCRLILEEEFDVLDASDAAQGLETLRRHEVDVVLLDVRLPGMDGLEALQHIKALDEHVEVILVTAVRTVRTAVTAMKLGAFDYLTKPVDPAHLRHLLGLRPSASTAAAPCESCAASSRTRAGTTTWSATRRP